MIPNSHLTNSRFKICDRDGDAYLQVKSANIDLIKAVVSEFDRVRANRSTSEVSALKELRTSGLIVTRNGLWNYRKGTFYTASTTFLNILAQWCGYANFFELLKAVEARESGESVRVGG